MRTRAAFVCTLLALALLLVSACDRSRPPVSTPEPGAPLLTFARSGGIAGFADRLVIGYGGEYYLTSRGGVERIGQLGAERRTQLRTWLERMAPLTLRMEDNPGGPDNMLHELLWSGQGKETATQAEQEEMLNWVTDLFVELSREAQ